MQWTHYDHTNKNSKGHNKLKRQVDTTSMGIYFFLIVLVVTFVLALAR